MLPHRPSRRRGAHGVPAALGLALVLALSSGVRAQCFPSSPVAGFFEESIGGEVSGVARADGERIELCSASRGYGQTTDSLQALVQDAPNEFRLSVEVVALDLPGQAGVEARVFRGTGSDPAQALVRIVVEEDAAGAGFAVVSGVRSAKGAKLDPHGVASVPARLPVRLGIERDGNRITTFYFGEEGRVEHLSVEVAPDSELDARTYRVAMVHGGDYPAEVEPRSGVATFRDPVLLREQSTRPPRLSPAVESYPATVDQPSVLTIRGTGLSATREVTVAGVAARILSSEDHTLTVEVPAMRKPVRGDVVVHTPAGSSEIPGGFSSVGKSFIRCDCNGTGDLDISDMIKLLDYLFIGGPPCDCHEAGDCNDDDDLDLSDAIRGLNFLFISNEGGLPPPYPEPGVDPTAPLCGLEDQVPTLTGISQSRIEEGDVFEVTGAGFSASSRVVIPGTQLEILARSAESMTVRANRITAPAGTASVRLLADFGPPVSTLCRPTACASTSIGPLSALALPVDLVPFEPAVAVSAQESKRGPIVLQLDPDAFDPASPLEVTAHLEAPAFAGVSPGGRTTAFRMAPVPSFEECVVALGERLYFELSAGGYLTEADVLPEPELGQIVIVPSESFPASSALCGQVTVEPAGPIGRCGPDETHPLDDEREHAWCRFEELVEPCNGLPAFEWYIPLSYVKSKSNALGGLPHPSNRSPHDKEIMYNWDAYCHVRRHRLWNLCALERLVDLGRTDIPEFPVGAWVTKTLWRTAEEIPAGVDMTKLYSYVYNGDGRTYYLTAIHHTTKDIGRWFWYDLYPPAQVLEGTKGDFVRGVGGCGGTDVDAPAWVEETIWENYYLCTNVTREQPLSTSGIGGVGPTATENSAWCGNFEFATECPDVIDAANLEPADDCFSGDATCLECHEDGSLANVGGSTLGTDFLHTLKSAVPEPDPCQEGDELEGPFNWVEHVGPFTSNHCFCHSNWMEYGTLVDAPSSDVPSMKRIKPFDPDNSYVWRKLTNTHLVLCPDDPVPEAPENCGVPMPKGGYPLTDSQLSMIEEWILMGAPYD